MKMRKLITQRFRGAMTILARTLTLFPIPSANSSAVEIPNVGHIPHLEAGEIFFEELLSLLKR